MEKVYILSEHPDKEVEQAIHDMPADKLRVALYGIARGWKFDEAMDISIFIGMDKQASWLEAAQQSVQADICPTCRGTGKIYGEFDFIYCSKCGGKGKCR